MLVFPNVLLCCAVVFLPVLKVILSPSSSSPLAPWTLEAHAGWHTLQAHPAEKSPTSPQHPAAGAPGAVSSTLPWQSCLTSSSREQMCKQTDVSAPGRPRASKSSWTQAREEQIHYKEARMLKSLPKCKAKSQPGAGSNYLAAEKHWKQRGAKDCTESNVEQKTSLHFHSCRAACLYLQAV